MGKREACDSLASKGAVAAPEEQGQDGHEEGMRTQIGGKGEVGIEEGSAQAGLEGGEERCLCSDEREEGVS